jgi:hypothetical protein
MALWLIVALDVDGWSGQRTDRIRQGMGPAMKCIGGSVGLDADLDVFVEGKISCPHRGSYPQPSSP